MASAAVSLGAPRGGFGEPRPWHTAAVAAAGATGAAALLWWLRRRERVLRQAPFSLQRVLRPNVRRLQMYAFPPRYDYEDPVLLDANESPYQSPAGEQRLHLERYPDPRFRTLRSAVAGLSGLSADEVCLGNGSDEVIDLLIRVFCEPGKDSIVVCNPTYSMYSVFASFSDVATVDVPLTADFKLRPEAVVAALTRRTKLVFLCSPGNPTGRLLDLGAMEAVMAAATGAVVVVDEAYVEFSPQGSVVPLLRSGRYPNLVVMRTLSKAWGLAGARVGVALAPRPIVDVLMKVKAPFNISSLTEDVALQALRRSDAVSANVRRTLAERERLAQELRALAPAVSEVMPSDANFLLFRCPRAKQVSEAVAKGGNVVVRYRGSMPQCEDCIRVTVGTATENDQFLTALKRAIS